jgi:hypothetical protein
MTLAIHLILTILASLFGWDTARRLSPVSVPGVVARVLIAVLATVLWILCPVPILAGMAVVGALMLVGQLVAVEPHWEWGKALADQAKAKRQLHGQEKTKRVVEQKMADVGKSFHVEDHVGRRISKL